MVDLENTAIVFPKEDVTMSMLEKEVCCLEGKPWLTIWQLRPSTGRIDCILRSAL
jgi:hypothetical protein